MTERLVVEAAQAPPAALQGLLAGLLAEVGEERFRAMLDLARVEALATPVKRRPAEHEALKGHDLQGVAELVASAHDLEGLARPLLEALHDLSGMSSTYLTVVDEAMGVQEIRYSLNTDDGFALPEGLEVPWADTLCKRALDEGRPCSTDVTEVWGDSDAARDLGIQSYVSVPVRLADGRLWGTLCGADPTVVGQAARQLPTMTMFARLIAGEVERAAALARAQRASEVDALTGCATRRGIDLWLDRARDSTADSVAAVFVDLDGFKEVNDTHGHEAGDAVLAAIGRELRTRSRSDDLVGRFGGDEFVVGALLRAADVPGFVRRWGEPLVATITVAGEDVPVTASVGLAMVPARRVDDLLKEADRAMYEVKQRRSG